MRRRLLRSFGFASACAAVMGGLIAGIIWCSEHPKDATIGGAVLVFLLIWFVAYLETK